MNFDVNKHYADYSERVRKYMSIIISYLEEKYGKLDEVYLITLDLIATNLDIVFNAQDSIKKDGFTIKDYKERTIKNYAIQNFNNAQAYLIKLINEFGLTPQAKRRLLASIEQEDPNDQVAEYL